VAALTLASAAGATDRQRKPIANKAGTHRGSPAMSPQKQADGNSACIGVFDYFAHDPEHGWLQRVLQGGQGRESLLQAVTLYQVVGPDREEIGPEQVAVRAAAGTRPSYPAPSTQSRPSFVNDSHRIVEHLRTLIQFIRPG